MHTIRITNRPKNQTKTEVFLDDTLTVVSHSGLHQTERLLIAHLPRLPPDTASLLVAGNRTGAVALAAAARFPGCAVTCHAFDLHHARAIARNLDANGMSSRLLHDGDAAIPTAADADATVACTAAIPPAPYAAALFMSTPGTTSSELILDQLEDIHRNLADGAPLLLACEADSVPLLKQIRAIFGKHTVLFDKKGIFCVLAKKQGALARPRDFSAEFPASLPGLEPCTLVSLPGVFCHRRPDMGGLALAEVAARELQPGQRALDMGCGCGLVGILLMRSQPDVHVTFVDSHARALAATRRNLDALGLSDRAMLFLSDEGIATKQSKRFDLAASNPPYYSDFRIAELFMQTMHDTLTPGGTSLTVAKAARAIQERQSALFGNAEVIPRRGYGVVKSIRR